ncbi:unnamed protein product [Gongylonema pulchrum]|uniref:CN hydrolase domain-containing protein n=1 Tax=Gongylonema pulchrum TaxID=637853 RepID=A0A183D7T2_9BILA|nr:unnamed protein product [Gongylonema pulchrum]
MIAQEARASGASSLKIFPADISGILLAESRDEQQIDQLTSEISLIVKVTFFSFIAFLVLENTHKFLDHLLLTT